MAEQPKQDQEGSFYQRHKTGVWVGGAVLLAGGVFFLYKYLHKSSTNTTNQTTATTGSAVQPVYVGYAPTSASAGTTTGSTSGGTTGTTTNSAAYAALLTQITKSEAAQTTSFQNALSTVLAKFESYINTQAAKTNPGGTGSQSKTTGKTSKATSPVTTKIVGPPKTTTGKTVQPGGPSKPLTTTTTTTPAAQVAAAKATKKTSAAITTALKSDAGGTSETQILDELVH